MHSSLQILPPHMGHHFPSTSILNVKYAWKKNLLYSCIECMCFLQPVFYAVVSFPLGHFSMHFDAFQQQIGELPPALPARSLRKVLLTKFLPFSSSYYACLTSDLKHCTCTPCPDFPESWLECNYRFLDVQVGLCIWVVRCHWGLLFFYIGLLFVARTTFRISHANN